MITQKILTDAGYSWHPGGVAWIKNADGLYQRRVYSPSGLEILYHINIWYYKPHEAFQGKEAFEPDCQFLFNGRERFTVTYLGDMDLKKIEDFFNQVYNRMLCNPEGD